MIKHIVMWKLKDNNKEENAMLEGLKSEIKEIEEIEVGININKSDASMDVCLVSVFKSLEDLDIYQNHEKHVRVATFVREVSKERKVADFEI